MQILLIILTILITGSVLMLCVKSEMVRDIVDEKIFKEKALNILNPKKPFSLSRVQLTLWTVVILLSCLYIAMMCPHGGIFPIFEKTELVLLGLSALTLAVAGTIDNTQMDVKRHQDQLSKGFITDILSDENGISIHRLQSVLFTIGAVIIYINFVFLNCSFPVFDDSLLWLLTLSYGGYLGVKVGENKPKTDNP